MRLVRGEDDRAAFVAAAEGIETSQQRHMLSAIGCTVGQGYLFARPMPADAVIGWQHPTLAVVKTAGAAG